MKRISFFTIIFYVFSAYLHAQNLPPVIQAPTEIIELSGKEITINADSTYDPDGDEIIANWNILYKPNGSTSNLNTNGLTSTLNLDRPGAYILELEAIDSNENKSSKFIYVSSVLSAGEIVFGPQEFLVKPKNIVDIPFTVTDPSGDFTILIENNGLISLVGCKKKTSILNFKHA